MLPIASLKGELTLLFLINKKSELKEAEVLVPVVVIPPFIVVVPVERLAAVIYPVVE
jgi:hypothetical protein